MKTNLAVNILRKFFHTKRIYSENCVPEITRAQINDIIILIKNNKEDGDHIINGPLLVQMKKGIVKIKAVSCGEPKR